MRFIDIVFPFKIYTIYHPHQCHMFSALFSAHPPIASYTPARAICSFFTKHNCHRRIEYTTSRLCVSQRVSSQIISKSQPDYQIAQNVSYTHIAHSSISAYVRGSYIQGGGVRRFMFKMMLSSSRAIIDMASPVAAFIKYMSG